MPWAAVLAVAGATALVLLAVSGRYGYHRDELYFREAGNHLAWGYVDQPPFTPFVARLSIAVFGDHVWSLRVLPALATAASVVLGALLARELGGDRRAQVLGAVVVAVSGFALGAGHLLSTATFDLTAWLALVLIAARMLRTGDARWWAAFGAVAGVALLNKNLVALLAVALVASLVLERRWGLLVTPWLAAGAGLALLIALPNLLWQANHDWPQVDMARAIADRIGGENRAALVPGQLLLVGPLLLPFFVTGVRRLLGLVDERPLLWAWPIALVLTFISGGRPYYPLPLAMVVVTAGVVAARGRWVVPLLVVSGLTVLPISLPVVPADKLADFPGADINNELGETVGWPQLADEVAAARDALPPAERSRVVLLTGTYGEAGALDRFGPSRGLSPANSPHNSYWDWRRPTDDTAPVLAVRIGAPDLAPYFDDCRLVGRVDNHLDVDNEAQGQPIVLCRGLRTTWASLWPRLRRLS